MTMGPVTCRVCGDPNHGDVGCSQLLGMEPLGDAALEYLRRWLQDHPQTSIPTGAQRALIARLDLAESILRKVLKNGSFAAEWDEDGGLVHVGDVTGFELTVEEAEFWRQIEAGDV